MADTVITYGDDTSGAQFILGAAGWLDVGVYWGNDGHSYGLSRDEAREIATKILQWADV